MFAYFSFQYTKSGLDLDTPEFPRPYTERRAVVTAAIRVTAVTARTAPLIAESHRHRTADIPDWVATVDIPD
jgi:hypothetical protein